MSRRRPFAVAAGGRRPLALAVGMVVMLVAGAGWRALGRPRYSDVLTTVRVARAGGDLERASDWLLVAQAAGEVDAGLALELDALVGALVADGSRARMTLAWTLMAPIIDGDLAPTEPADPAITATIARALGRLLAAARSEAGVGLADRSAAVSAAPAAPPLGQAAALPQAPTPPSTTRSAPTPPPTKRPAPTRPSPASPVAVAELRRVALSPVAVNRPHAAGPGDPTPAEVGSAAPTPAAPNPAAIAAGNGPGAAFATTATTGTVPVASGPAGQSLDPLPPPGGATPVATRSLTRSPEGVAAAGEAAVTDPLALVCAAVRSGDWSTAAERLATLDAAVLSDERGDVLTAAVYFNASILAVKRGDCATARDLAAIAVRYDDPWRRPSNLSWWRTLSLVPQCDDLNLRTSLLLIRPKPISDTVCPRR